MGSHRVRYDWSHLAAAAAAYILPLYKNNCKIEETKDLNKFSIHFPVFYQYYI